MIDGIAAAILETLGDGLVGSEFLSVTEASREGSGVVRLLVRLDASFVIIPSALAEVDELSPPCEGVGIARVFSGRSDIPPGSEARLWCDWCEGWKGGKGGCCIKLGWGWRMEGSVGML